MILAAPAMLAAPVALALGHTMINAQDGKNVHPNEPRQLIAYLTRSGNTRVIAETLQRALKADLFVISPLQPYPADYEQHVAQATRERASGYEPPLAARVEAMAGYAEIFLGFPIWGETAPPPIRSFLTAYDWGGKTIRPFITHGGYGLGNSLSVIAAHAPDAQIAEAFVMEADQERRTLNQVNGWLGRIQG